MFVPFSLISGLNTALNTMFNSLLKCYDSQGPMIVERKTMVVSTFVWPHQMAAPVVAPTMLSLMKMEKHVMVWMIVHI